MISVRWSQFLLVLLLFSPALAVSEDAHDSKYEIPEENIKRGEGIKEDKEVRLFFDESEHSFIVEDEEGEHPLNKKLIPKRFLKADISFVDNFVKSKSKLILNYIGNGVYKITVGGGLLGGNSRLVKIAAGAIGIVSFILLLKCLRNRSVRNNSPGGKKRKTSDAEKSRALIADRDFKQPLLHPDTPKEINPKHLAPIRNEDGNVISEVVIDAQGKIVALRPPLKASKRKQDRDGDLFKEMIKFGASCSSADFYVDRGGPEKKLKNWQWIVIRTVREHRLRAQHHSHERELGKRKFIASWPPLSTDVERDKETGLPISRIVYDEKGRACQLAPPLSEGERNIIDDEEEETISELNQLNTKDFLDFSSATDPKVLESLGLSRASIRRSDKKWKEIDKNAAEAKKETAHYIVFIKQRKRGEPGGGYITMKQIEDRRKGK